MRHHPPNADLENLTWLERAQDFLDWYGFPKDLLLDVVKHPEQTLVDPSTANREYPVLRHRRGDITVCVGYQTPHNPSVVYVYLHTPVDQNFQSPESGAGQSGGSKLPGTMRQLRSALIKAGITLETSTHHRAGRHTAVFYKGRRIGSLPSTPSDSRTIPNTYMDMLRKMTAAKALEEYEARKSAQ